MHSTLDLRSTRKLLFLLQREEFLLRYFLRKLIFFFIASGIAFSIHDWVPEWLSAIYLGTGLPTIAYPDRVPFYRLRYFECIDHFLLLLFSL